MKIRCLIVALLMPVAGAALAVGSYPIPQINQVEFNAGVEYDAVTGQFTYQYEIGSDASNQGDILYIFLDVKTTAFRPAIPPAEFTFSTPRGPVPTTSKIDSFLRYNQLPYQVSIETLATDLPEFWGSGYTGNGFLMIRPPLGGIDQNGQAITADPISPGEFHSGLIVKAISAPTLREVLIEPDWRLVTTGEDAAEALRDEANQLAQDLLVRITTIGPGALSFSGYQFHDRIVDDIDSMIDLGWIIDQALILEIKNLLEEAKSFLLQTDGTQAKQKYREALDLMSTVSEVQMRKEASDLIQVNIQIKIDVTPDTTIRAEPALIVNPVEQDLLIGETAVFNPKLVDRAREDREISTFDFYTLEVISGPNTGLVVTNFGDSIGYSGSKVGSDIVEITRQEIPEFALNDNSLLAAMIEEESEFQVRARVNWSGGPDYVISFFSPPFLEFEGAESIWIYEETKNIGTTGALDTSKTRYYLSTSPTIDPATAYQLSQRDIGLLNRDAESKSGPIEIAWPSQFPEGTYYFAACADSDNSVAELNESNNCSFHQVDKVAYVVGVLGEEEANVNVPPNCDNAFASQEVLWPPNHKFVNISVEGVTDADQDSVLITIMGITQDEPVDGIASGNTSPDGMGVGTPTAQVRSERQGTGDGRVYSISFKATDAAGNECTGSVATTSVTHDQRKKNQQAIDSGQVYDSTVKFE